MTPSAARLAPEPLAEATALLQRHVDAGTSAGVVAMLGAQGKPAYVATVGVQDLATRAPMTERTLFRIYSITKPITAVAVMMLFERARSRSTTASDDLPEFAGVTVRSPEGSHARPRARRPSAICSSTPPGSSTAPRPSTATRRSARAPLPCRSS